MEVLAQARGAEVELTLRDHGPGVPAAVLAELFENARRYGHAPGDCQRQRWRADHPPEAAAGQLRPPHRWGDLRSRRLAARCGGAQMSPLIPGEPHALAILPSPQFAARRSIATTALLALALSLAPDVRAQASCSTLLSDLRSPGGLAITPHVRLLIGESGTLGHLVSRISLLDEDGRRRTLLDGLPAGVADVGEPSGVAGLALRGRTLYVAIGVGDVVIRGPLPGSAQPNPAGPSSPLFSSVLALHFSADVERGEGGFTLLPGDDWRLAQGQTLELHNASGERMTLRRVADMPNHVPRPLPSFPANVQSSNPYQLALAHEALFVTDGGRNLVWRIELGDGLLSELASFPDIANPLFGIVGGPMLQAVPTGIARAGDQLLVSLFRGAPFPPGTSTIQQLNPVTGGNQALHGGLKTAIAVEPLAKRWGGGLLVMQHASLGPFFGGPGLLLQLRDGGTQPIANCLSRPTAMAIDERRGRVLVSELGGRLLAVPLRRP